MLTGNPIDNPAIPKTSEGQPSVVLLTKEGPPSIVLLTKEGQGIRGFRRKIPSAKSILLGEPPDNQRS
jgi:hypothetical protein